MRLSAAPDKNNPEASASGFSYTFGADYLPAIAACAAASRAIGTRNGEQLT